MGITILNYLLFPVSLILAVYIFANFYGSVNKIIAGLFLFTTALIILGTGLAYDLAGAKHFNASLIITRFTGLFLLADYLIFLRLAIGFPVEKPMWRWNFILAVVFFSVAIVVLFTPLYVVEITLKNDIFYRAEGQLYKIISSISMLISVIGISVFIIRMKKISNDFIRSQIKVMVIGLFISLNFGILFGVIMPSVLKIYRLYPLSSIMALSGIVFLFYAVFVHEYFRSEIKAKLNLKRKTLVVIVIILFLSIGITTFINIITSVNSLKKALIKQIYTSGFHIEQNLKNLTRNKSINNLSGLNDYFNHIVSENKGLDYIFLSNKNGRILYHNDKSLCGKTGQNSSLLNKKIIEKDDNYEGVIPINLKNQKSGFILHVGMKKKIIDFEIIIIIIQTLGIFIFALMVSAFLLLLFIGKNVVHPLLKLHRDINNITTNMNFNNTVIYKGEDEIAELGKAFNLMISEIKNYSQNLEDLVKERTNELNFVNEELDKKNKKLLNDLEIAKRIQESIIDNIPEIKEFYVDSQYMAMEALGGDVYDVRRIGKYTYSFMISDVSGHGVSSALITTMAKTSFINHSHFTILPHETCTRVNEDLYRLIGDTEYYLTAFYATFDLNTMLLSYTNCGHQFPLIYKHNTGKIIELKAAGMFIGFFEQTDFETYKMKLEINDKILFFTDGITEARNEQGELYGNNRLINFFQKTGKFSADDILTILINDVNDFSAGRAPEDDRALLLVQILEQKNNKGDYK